MAKVVNDIHVHTINVCDFLLSRVLLVIFIFMIAMFWQKPSVI